MDKLQVGLIGCGMFARAVQAPTLMKNPKYRIRAAMDIEEAAAAAAAEETGADYRTTDVERVLADENIDVVFINTRHDTHAQLTMKAAEAGKHVFCEKPMGMNREECKAVAEAVKRNGIKYTVGYNRGVAPLVTKARDLLGGLSAKKLVYHRIQSPFPADYWVHDPSMGGGRFIGEGCHIFDLICELVQSSPVSVYASGGVFLDPAKVKMPDSAMVTITFADGSVGITMIASAGCATLPKESTEIVCDNKAITIADFREMEYMGFDGQDKVRLELPSVDKGWAVELDALADAIISDTESPNGLVKAVRAAVISFMVNESIATGVPIAMCESDYVF